MRFKVKDNDGNIHTSKNYEWDKDNGIPSEEEILEDMEECSCIMGENKFYCDGSCNRFDFGEVVEVIQQWEIK